MTKVFVYGTLRKCGKLHRYMDGGKFIGMGKLKGYTMYTCIETKFPCLVEDSFTTDNIIGEIYEFEDDSIFKVLDDVEEVESKLFIRKVKKISCDNGKNYMVNFYYNEQSVVNRLNLSFKRVIKGDWDNVCFVKDSGGKEKCVEL